MLSPSIPNPKHFTLSSGVRVLDRFTIQRGVGIGGFGEVYFAISDAGKEVALKRIQRNLEVELRGVTHCLNLKHPNLLSLHDICRDSDEIWWVVMEYVAGPSLRDTLDDHPQGLSESETLDWFLQAAAGVEHLHQQGLVHRDLKPANLFDDLGVIKVGDYGLSKFISDARRGGQTEGVGTFHYMAPEVGDGKYGHEIDIYALGVILCESLTGRLPFQGDTSREILHKHQFAQPELDGIAAPMRAVIERALRKDPRQRWGSVAEMADALRATRSSSPADAAAASNGTHSPSLVTEMPAGHRNGSDPNRHFDRPQPSPAPNHLQAAAPVQADAWSFLADLWQDPPLPIPHTATRRLVGRVVLVWLAWLCVSTAWVLLVRTGGRSMLIALGASELIVLGLAVAAVLLIRSSRSGQRSPATGDRSGGPDLLPSTPPELARHEAHRADGSPPVAHYGGSKRYQVSRRQVRLWQLAELAARPTSSKLAELAGSWVAAAIAILVCCAVAGWFVVSDGATASAALAPLAWVGTVSLLLAASLLALGKLWEASEWGGIRWRMAFALLGGAVGAVAYALQEHLMLPITHGRHFNPNQLPGSLRPLGQYPELFAFTLHFAILLACFRWTRWTDPFRRRRLALFWIPVVPVTAWFIDQAFPINQPWGLMVATVTVIAVQVAAVWERPQPGTRLSMEARRANG
ncbi:MAG: serine/threonine protein kinase [Planctomycetaceae bacterium]|nr:MAG: serine/threonine protein kinase [Planctomycetaceae bacterium]